MFLPTFQCKFYLCNHIQGNVKGAVRIISSDEQLSHYSEETLQKLKKKQDEIANLTNQVATLKQEVKLKKQEESDVLKIIEIPESSVLFATRDYIEELDSKMNDIIPNR